MRGTHLLAAAVTCAAVLPGSVPARADRPLTEVLVSIAPSEVKQGDRFTLTGRGGSGNTGNAAPVDIYFRKADSESAPYVRLTTVQAAASGTFRATLTARNSGYYMAFYRGNKQRGFGTASDHLAAYTSTVVDRLRWTWSSDRLQCHPECVATGPEQQLSAGPIRVTFTRDCVQAGSSGGAGFVTDPKKLQQAAKVPTKSDPGWRDFPPGAGPTAFDLTPNTRTGRFHLRWSSPAGPDSGCDLSFTATQRTEQKRYL